ncbi:aminoglycoside phosphotransferase family protein [Planktotalea arctica]|uniref:aminoglycoside phosphotransferase family protein n=1 Tax=Planktotalea arctica TaxID=1481893 RepID=UPI000A1718BF|nr:phosphotransferase [Planktotalea arctica]
MTTRDSKIDRFLHETNWQGATRAPLAGDASMRKYLRIGAGTDGRIAVLMDADPTLGNDVRPFLRITDYLRSIDLSAPEIYVADEDSGFLLIEDLGDTLYARVVEADHTLEHPLYEAAVDALLHLHRTPPPPLDPYDTAFMTRMAALSFEWYQRGAHTAIDTRAKAHFETAFFTLLDTYIDPPSVLIQRDYHAENLLWLPERSGVARVGLLDYQDALLGHPAYDLVSLLKDARRDVSVESEEAMIAYYIARSGMDKAAFRSAYHLLGLQRNLRILGVFARLSMHFGKPSYVDLIPRVWGLIQRDLEHPVNAPVADMLRQSLPAPTPEILQRLKDKCAIVPTL